MTQLSPRTSPSAPRAVIFCPLAFESSGIRRALARILNRKSEAAFGKTMPRIVQTGPGPGAIDRAVEVWFAGLPSTEPKPLALLAGVAGELAPGSSDVHIFTEAVSDDGNRWQSRLSTLGDAGLVILGLNTPAYTPEEKSHWREQSGAIFVDTESHAFARCCHRLRVPWAIVRGVSDRRHESLPSESSNWVDQQGNTKIVSVLKDLARRPSLLPAMIRLGKSGNRVLPLVARAIAQVIEKLPAAESHAAISHAHGAAPNAGSPITPLPDELARTCPPLVMLCGGSFDPPHIAHTELPILARAQLEREMDCVGRAWLLYVPAARSPLKQVGPVASDADRISMLRLCLIGTDRACVWTDEIDRSAVSPSSASYTIDTVRRLLALLSGTGSPIAGIPPTVRLLIGQDQALQFHRWHEARTLLRLAEPLVLVRRGAPSVDRGSGTPSIPTQSAECDLFMQAMRETGAWTEAELVRWSQRLVRGDIPMMDVSSTQIRRMLSAGFPVTDHAIPSGVLLPEVLDYIRQKNIYCGSTGGVRPD